MKKIITRVRDPNMLRFGAARIALVYTGFKVALVIFSGAFTTTAGFIGLALAMGACFLLALSPVALYRMVRKDGKKESPAEFLRGLFYGLVFKMLADFMEKVYPEMGPLLEILGTLLNI